MELINLTGQLVNQGDYGPRQRTDAIICHHTASDYESWGYGGVQTVQDIARYHVTALGWAGIGYNIIIARDGVGGAVKAYQTRPLDNQGAHTYGRNEVSVGFSMANNFSAKMPTEEWYKVAGEVVSFLKQKYPKAQLLGHREYALPGWGTACPGDNFNLDHWREWKFDYPQVTESQVELIPETGYHIAYGFRAFWKANGGVPIFGYPISEEIQEDDRTVQYFERAVFEYHPENPEPYKILLRRLGSEAHNVRYGQ